MPATQHLWPFRLSAGVAVVVFLALVARFWHPVWGFTSFLQLDASNDEVKIAAFKTLPVYVYRDTGGYDGLYYAQIAYHPTLQAPELAGALDNFTYRARRILPPALAWLLAFGRPAWIVYVYSTLNIVAWLALALVLWRLLDVRDWRGWLAWCGVMFSTGTLASVRLALTDLVALAVLAAAMLAVERSRGRAGAVLMAAAGLSRETSLVALGGLVRRPWRSHANLVRAIVAVAPLAVWLLYIQLSFDSHDRGWANLGRPPGALIEKLGADVSAVRHNGDWLLTWTTLAATVGLVVQAMYFAARPRLDDAWWRIGASYAALMLCLGTTVWEGFPGAATRVPFNLTADPAGYCYLDGQQQQGLYTRRGDVESSFAEVFHAAHCCRSCAFASVPPRLSCLVFKVASGSRALPGDSRVLQKPCSRAGGACHARW